MFFKSLHIRQQTLTRENDFILFWKAGTYFLLETSAASQFEVHFTSVPDRLGMTTKVTVLCCPSDLDKSRQT